jgi:hypothetical protein
MATVTTDGARTPDSPPEPARLIAELWYEEVPDLQDPRLLAALRAVSAQAELQDQSITVPHPEFTMELEEQGEVPLLTVVFPGSALDHEDKTLPDVSQTWDWAEAQQALERCTGSVLVSELLASLFPPQQRVTGLMSVVQVLVEQTHPLAISWPQSQRVTDPERLEPEGLDGVLNVRFFTVGDDEAMVMDTLGLDLFELPDVQCHYRDMDPAEVATMLYNTAVYLFAQGDVIDDGHTISGPEGDERYPCRHEPALIPPLRTVLDVDLGDPHAAGVRERS